MRKSSAISQGEQEICDILVGDGFQIEREYTFKDCRRRQMLPFDVCVFDFQNYDKVLIEFDGEQHFTPVKFFGGKRQFSRTQNNDMIKNRFALSRGIPLIRIPHWELDKITKVMLSPLYSPYRVKVVDHNEQYL